MPDIWVPRSFTGQRAKYVCRLCQERFYTPESQAAHVARHYKHDEADVRMLSMREKHPNLFGDGQVDTEFEGWHRRRGSGKKD